MKGSKKISGKLSFAKRTAKEFPTQRYMINEQSARNMFVNIGSRSFYGSRLESIFEMKEKYKFATINLHRTKR